MVLLCWHRVVCARHRGVLTLVSVLMCFLNSLLKGTSFQESSNRKTGRIRPAVGLRFEVGPGASVHSPLATQNGFLRFLLRGCDLELFTSVLNGLGPFLEDEDVPVVVPMQLELLNSSVTLKVRGTLVFALDSVVAVPFLSPHSSVTE